MEVLTNLRDESFKQLIDGLSDLIASAETIKHGEENIRRFSEHMIYVREIIAKLQSQQSGGQFTSRSTAGKLLRRMEIAVNIARETIEGHKSKSSLLRLIFSRYVLSKLNQSSKEIADVLSLLPLTHINTSLEIKSNLDAMIHSLKAMELKREKKAHAIHSGLDLYVSENSGNRQHMEQRLFHSPRAESATSSNGVEVESGESINEGYHITQELECFSSEIDSPSQSESTVDEIASPPSIFFYCILTLKLMEDPVNVSCNHSYERKAVLNYFRSGQKFCRVCKKEFMTSSSGELELTPNHTLRNTISEWKQRNARINAEKNAKKKLRDAAERIILDNMESTNRALEDLKAVMNEMPSCISEATESSCKLVPKLAELLRKSAGNVGLVLWCLLCIVRFSQENKEAIGKEGVIKCLLKQVKTEPIALIAVEILLELSTNDRIAQKFMKIKSSIPVLVSLLDNPNPYLAEMALSVLKNLSTSIDIAILMAKSGYFTPFLYEFNAQGTSEKMRAFMAEEMAKMQLTEAGASNLNNEQFIINLNLMLTCDLPASQLASLKCIKQLMSNKVMRILFLSTISTISTLLCVIWDTATEKQSKNEAFEILISLVEKSCQPLEQQSYPGLQKLYSSNNIQNLLEQIEASSPDDQLWLLRLLLAMFQNSDTAREWIISDQNAMSHLFSTLNLDRNSEVKSNALKLVYCITGNYSSDIPLPPSVKDTTLSSIIAILTESCIDEVSIALNIISHLPCDDRSMNEMLQSSAVLKAIHALISHANKSNEFSENALGALLRCINQSNYGFLVQVSKFEPVLVQMLSTCASPLIKQRAAMILAHLARFTPEPSTSLISSLHSRWPSWQNPFSTRCIAHESCSLQRVICLVKAGAVRPLVDMVDAMNPATSEAALMALDTLFDTDNLEPAASQSSFNTVAVDIIVENNGAAPILKVLERGPIPLKKVALELFGKIYMHPGVTGKELEKFKAILLYLLNEEDELKKKAKILLAELVSSDSF